ncbi:MAG: hypothetical protein DRI86_15175, partial [Bacteroidetes bacterium]
MTVDIKIDDKTYECELIERNGDNVKIKIDGKVLEADIQNLTSTIYSFLYDNQSFDVEVNEGTTNKDFVVNTMMERFETTVIDAEAKYQMA